MEIRILLIVIVSFLLSGCATIQKPDYEIGWIDSYLSVPFDGGVGLVDAECLIDDDFLKLKEICPSCTEEKAIIKPEGTNEDADTEISRGGI
jgi:hypothetical protein